MNEGDCNVSRDSLSDWSDLDEVPGENLVVTETPPEMADRESQDTEYTEDLQSQDLYGSLSSENVSVLETPERPHAQDPVPGASRTEEELSQELKIKISPISSVNSQPVETQDVMPASSISQTEKRLRLGVQDIPPLTQLDLTRSIPIDSQESSQPSQYVQLKQSESSEQREPGTSHLSNMVPEEEEEDSPVKRPSKRKRLVIESQESKQDSQGSNESQTQGPDSQTSNESMSPPKKRQLKSKMTNDGRKILYSERVRVPMWKYYDERGRLVYEEAEVVDSPVNTPSCSGTSSSGTQSSGYNADKEAASGSSSGQSQNSQDFILKTHRSAEDNLFVSPPVPKARDSSSAPPQPKPKNNDLPQLPKPQDLQSIVTTQQRHAILASLNAKPRFTAADLTPQNNSTLSNLSGISPISAAACSVLTQRSTLDDPTAADTEPPSQDLSHHSLASAPRANLSGNIMSLQKANGKKKRKRKRSVTSLMIQHGTPYRIRSARNLPAPHKREFVVDARVVAKWSNDAHYYTGRLLAKSATQLDKWQILYDDHNTGWATRSDIFECTEIPRSHNILARKDEDSDYQSAVVHDSPDGGFKYNISFLDDSQTPEVVCVQSADICLEKGHFDALKQRIITNASGTEDERDHAHQGGLPGAMAAIFPPPQHSTPTPLKMSEATARKRAQIFSDVTTSPVKTRDPKKASTGDGEASAGKRLLFGQTGSTSCDVFNGFVFMVTNLRHDKLVEDVTSHNGLEETPPTETEDAENTAPEEMTSPNSNNSSINKDEICAKIEALGGMVIDKYDGDIFSIAKEKYLISAGFQRTVKYLQCLAANIPPVSYHWIEQCYLSQKLCSTKEYMLPAGVEIGGKLVEWSNRLEGGEPLHNTSVYLAAKPNQQQFLDDWNSILNIAGACVIKKISVNSGLKPEFIIVHKDGCTKNILTQAMRLNIKCVTPEWAVQRLITGMRLEPTYSQCFIYSSNRS